MYLFSWNMDKKKGLILLWFVSILGILAVWFSNKSSIGILSLLGIEVMPNIKLAGAVIILVTVILTSYFVGSSKEGRH